MICAEKASSLSDKAGYKWKNARACVVRMQLGQDAVKKCRLGFVQAM